jgi:hypothetical protein
MKLLHFDTHAYQLPFKFYHICFFMDCFVLNQSKNNKISKYPRLYIYIYPTLTKGSITNIQANDIS